MPTNDVIKSNSLTDLAARIKTEHEAVVTAAKHGAEHAMNAGDLLAEAKTRFKHGQWLPWLRDHIQISERTAQLYMRMAKARPEIKANTQRVADLSLRAAMAVISPDPDETARAEGQAIADRIRMAEANIMVEAKAYMERLRDFAVELYQLPTDEQAAILAVIGKKHCKLVPRWSRINDDTIAQAQWRISCLLAEY